MKVNVICLIIIVILTIILTLFILLINNRCLFQKESSISSEEKIEQEIIFQKEWKYLNLSFIQLDENILNTNSKKIMKKNIFISPKEYEWFNQTILEPVRMFYTSFLQIQSLNNSIMLSNKKCLIDLSKLRNINHQLITSDFIIFIQFNNNNKNSKAISRSYTCQMQNFHRNFEKPVVGVIKINYNKVHFFNDNPQRILKAKNNIFHEITHCLVFRRSLFKKFVFEKDGLINIRRNIIRIRKLNGGKKRRIIKDEIFKKEAFEYFNCPNNKGFPLDNKLGKSGSHFDQQLVIDSFMKPVNDYQNLKITPFLAKLYYLSGWYRVNYTFVEDSLFGKRKGCDYLNLKCKNKDGKRFEEFCKYKGEIGCDFYYDFKSICKKNRLSNCKYMVPISIKSSCLYIDSKKELKKKPEFEFYGIISDIKKSKCFMELKRNIPLCLKSSCDLLGRTISFYIKDKQFTAFYKSGKPYPSLYKIKFKKKTYRIEFPENFNRFCYSFTKNKIKLF